LQATRSLWSYLEISTFVVDLSANKKVQSVLESKESGRKGHYSKLSPKLKVEIGRRAAEHVVAATVRLYAKTLPNCWAMGVVNLKLEVDGASTAW